MFNGFFNFFRRVRDPDKDFWIWLTDIPMGSILTLQTETHRYDFRVLDNHGGKVEPLSHHEMFLNRKYVYIQGSWLPEDGWIKVRSFAVGYQVVITIEGGLPLTTDPLLELQVNGRRDLPVPETMN